MTEPIFDTHAHYSSRAFDADRFALLDSLPDKENIAANVEATLRDMETSTPVEEGRPVHFPGAHMAEVRSDNMENGIPVEEAIWQQVLAL